jgi:hypothetical protein
MKGASKSSHGYEWSMDKWTPMCSIASLKYPVDNTVQANRFDGPTVQDRFGVALGNVA